MSNHDIWHEVCVWDRTASQVLEMVKSIEKMGVERCQFEFEFRPAWEQHRRSVTFRFRDAAMASWAALVWQ